MINSVATAVAGLMFVVGVALVGFTSTKVADASSLSSARLKPSIIMLKSY
jgi:hypothetical protein